MSSPSDILEFSAGSAAFGDGSHPTTAGVLAALEAIDSTVFSPQNACDVGCGSGILSFAIAKLFSCPVFATDISAQAIETMQQNAARNNVNNIHAYQASGLNHPAVQQAAPYDLIVMNILAEPLLMLARDAERALASGGVLIISGLFQWQEPQMQEAYASLGLELSTRLTLGDWVTLVWQKA